MALSESPTSERRESGNVHVNGTDLVEKIQDGRVCHVEEGASRRRMKVGVQRSTSEDPRKDSLVRDFRGTDPRPE